MARVDPVVIIPPSARTTSSPSTYCFVVPYFTARLPLALVETIPPREARVALAGSGGKKWVGARAMFRLLQISPGSAMTYPSCFLISRIRFIRLRSRRIPPFAAKAPPTALVPEPLGVTGIFSALATARILETCSELLAKTITSGVASWTDRSLE